MSPRQGARTEQAPFALTTGRPMRCLVVHSGNVNELSPFIKEQMDSISRIADVEFSVFTIKGKGISGYTRNLPKYYGCLKENGIDIVHAHYGLSGAFSCMQGKVPVVTTFHGSDININRNLKRFLSRFAMQRSSHSIFVSSSMLGTAKARRKSVIPCGVDLETFRPMNKSVARERMGLDADKQYVLFSSSFTNPVKNAALAFGAVNLLKTRSNVELLELKGYTRPEVALLMNAADVGLMTSFAEGSPQFVKEALACNLPIVSTNVGDVEQRTTGIAGCYVCDSYDPGEVADKLTKTMIPGGRISGRQSVGCLESRHIAKRIAQVYFDVVG